MFKQRKHKTFSYKPRFSKEGSNPDLEERDKKDFVSKWRRQTGNKVEVRSIFSMRTLILALVLLLICMYLLEKNYL